MTIPKALFAALLVSGCAFEFEVNSQRTSLENQVLGAYKEIDDDLVLVSSVRGSPTSPVSGLSPERKRAVDAKLNQDFNRDDIEELKDHGVLGEAKDGRVTFLPDSLRQAGVNSKQIALAKSLIDEENRDRAEIWRRIIRSNRNLTDKDLPAVRETYAKLQRESALPGHYVQDVDGQWRKTPGA